MSENPSIRFIRFYTRILVELEKHPNEIYVYDQDTKHIKKVQ